MKDRALQVLQQAASEFVNRESNRTSLITVTNVSMDNRGLNAEVYISVFPKENTQAATEFLSRKRNDFREFMKKKLKLRAIPRVTFLADPNPAIGDTE